VHTSIQAAAAAALCTVVAASPCGRGEVMADARAVAGRLRDSVQVADTEFRKATADLDQEIRGLGGRLTPKHER